MPEACRHFNQPAEKSRKHHLVLVRKYETFYLDEITICQSAYAKKIVEISVMKGCNFVDTPMEQHIDDIRKMGRWWSRRILFGI